MATIEEITLQLRILAWGMTNMKDERHRMSKEIAQELRDQLGEGAYLYCVEKLSNDTANPRLWRDVLTWLDEGETNGGDGVVSDRHRQSSESEKHEPSDS